MTAAFAVTLAYLATNFAFMVWLERARDRGRPPSARVAAFAAVLRYGPPLAGAAYLVVISGDWLFVVFVLAFFAGAAWLLNGLLAYTNHGSGPPGGRRRDRR